MGSQKVVAGAGGIGSALGVLFVLFLPDSVIVFTPETAAIATAAFGVVFGYLMAFVPKPGGN